MRIFFTIGILSLFLVSLNGCRSQNWYEEQDLGDGYLLFANPYEILYTEDNKNYEYVIEPRVMCYAFDSNYIIAKTHKKKDGRELTRYWIVDKKDTISSPRDSVIHLPDNTTCIYRIKGSVRGPFDLLTYKKYLDSLNINLKLRDVLYIEKH
ncbi:MAG: hypothetical protein J6Y78_08355 [Paludibacteraceae bacterium]|nr:hypothetical protein [Paludibacteraceae bacterium]